MSATPLLRARRLVSAPLLLIALALVLVTACGDSEQSGYEVAIPLLEPVDFEDLDPLPTLRYSVALSSSNPTYVLNPFSPEWTSLFMAQQFAEGEVPDGQRIEMAMTDTVFEGDPVTISVRIFSSQGLIVGRDSDYVPTTPAACSFPLDSSSSGDDYAQGLNDCLAAWIDENGSPVDFDMEVTATPRVAAAAASLESGTRPKQVGFFAYSGQWEMRSTNQCDVGGTDDPLGAIIEGEEFFELLECGALGLRGVGNTDYPIAITGGVAIWDACGNRTIGVLLPTGLLPGEYSVTVRGSSAGVMRDQDVPVVLFPSAVDFTQRLLSAATGLCSGPKTTVIRSPGGIAGWSHCGPINPPTVRTGSMRVEAAGFCAVAPIPPANGQ